MSTTDRNRWNGKYAHRPAATFVDADEWLIEAHDTITQNTPDLTVTRRAVDLACGIGHNSVWLAQHGWDVDGVDISIEGLGLAEQLATKTDAVVNWVKADLDNWRPDPDSYDLAVVFRFLDRVTVPQIVNTGLKPGGWLIYETFAASELDRADSHIRNPAFTLSPGELRQLFDEFEIVAFREETLQDRSVQRLLARRR
jgi:tellurite methyltransferase